MTNGTNYSIGRKFAIAAAILWLLVQVATPVLHHHAHREAPLERGVIYACHDHSENDCFICHLYFFPSALLDVPGYVVFIDISGKRTGIDERLSLQNACVVPPIRAPPA